MTPNTNPMPPLTPVQLDLTMPGCESALEQAWQAHARHLPHLTLAQALEHELYGRLIRAHAGAIERMRRHAARRRLRRVHR
jgi:hypothetical protein